MFESNSRFPKIFVYVMFLLVAVIFVGIFFSVKFVAVVYLTTLIIAALLLLLDKKYGTLLTNYKLTFMLFELVNLIAVISVIYYEYSNHSKMLNVFLIMLVVIEVLMILIDVFVMKNKDLSKRTNILIDFLKLCSMICIITYFFGVSKLYFAVTAFSFECLNLIVKIAILERSKRKINVTGNSAEKLEDIIHSNNDNPGDDD